jgi:two-component system C4-dicarboxylate transport sensor histidine kinase DctB
VADVERNLQLIADLTERLGKMTSQLKSFAHKGPAANGWVPLATAVNNVLQILEGRIRDEGVRLTLDVPGSLRVRCDAYRLEQVLLNLCSNAIDAMCDAPTKELAVTARADGQRVRVRVSDTGPGIPAQVKEHLFEPFFSTKPPGQGLGLGLVISSGMVGEFGGVLRTVEVAQGAAFEFDLSMEEACSHV